jgi:hypothetical protein
MVDIDTLPPVFEREYGCTTAEWARWMAEFVTGGRAVEDRPEGAIDVALGDGRLTVRWRALPPRAIALIRLPRLSVHFAFDRVSSADRSAFMRHLDLRLQRGGG